MIKYYLPLTLLFFSLSQSIFANTAPADPIMGELTMCNGEKMTWAAYTEMRQCQQEEEEKIDKKKKFRSFTPSMINSTNGAWSSVIDMPLVAAAAAQRPDGKIVYWSAKDKFSFGGANGRTWTATFDPATNTTQEALITNTAHDMFCPGINQLPDGRIMVTGGSNSNRTSIYDPMTSGWSSSDNMNIARGYHSNVTLASGATFLIGGSWSGGVGNKHAEIWSEKSGWYEVPGVPVDAIIEGLNSSQPVKHDDYFPWLWVAPNGNLFHAGPNQRMHWIDPTGNGSYTFAGTRGNDAYSVSGTTVMYDVGKILKTGGSNTFEERTAGTNRCYSIDINQQNVNVTQVGSMQFPRVYHNSVVLPTGEVLALGGIPISHAFSDNNSVLATEIWNPNTQTWRTVATMATPRNYHSVGLLMQDGRVIMAGGGLCGTCSTNHPDAEIFSPPYLFNSNGTLASRPVLSGVPSSTDYNTSITVTATGGAASFSLVRSSAVTHSTNNDQRRIPISATSLGNNRYRLSIPNRNILPPGDYMLFAMKSSGTPSIAKVINVGDDINDCTPISAPNLGGTGLSATYFNNTNLTSPVVERVDATVNFNWGTNAPVAGVGADTYSVRWEGDIKVPRSGTYTFYTNTDDGVRLWVNNKLIVSKWIDQGATEWKGMIHLDQDVFYDIKMEYYEAAGSARAQLRWSGPGITKKIIPQGNLFPNCIGGDSDGDGICNATDNCPNDANPNQADADGDGIGDVCDTGGGNGGTCNDVTAVGTNGQVTISNIATAAKVEIAGPSTGWALQLVCNGDCQSEEIVNNLQAGNYSVKIQTFSPYCYAQIDLPVSGGGGGNPCDGQGGDSDGDGICNNSDNCPNNANPNQADSDGDGIGDVCDGGGGGGGSNCQDVTAVGSNGQITISNIAASAKVDAIGAGTGWQLVSVCDGDCQSQEIVPNLPAGDYSVKIQTFSPYCYAQIDLPVSTGGGGGNPCDGQGGDSDGDGICNNSDNCPNTANANQADSDGDGIGDACDNGGGGGGQDCEGVTANFTSSTSLVISNLSAPIVILKVYTPSWSPIFQCIAGDCPETVTVQTTGAAGNYIIDVQFYTNSWSQICQKTILKASGNLDSADNPISFLVAPSTDRSNLHLNNSLLETPTIKAFPNPVQDELFINASTSFMGQKGNLIITNQLGQIVKEVALDHITNAPIAINTAGLKNGLHYVLLKGADQQMAVTKVMVIR